MKNLPFIALLERLTPVSSGDVSGIRQRGIGVRPRFWVFRVQQSRSLIV